MKKMMQENTQVQAQAGVWKLEDQISRLAEPFLSAEGFELVQVQCIFQDKNQIVRISADKKGGITLDDCVYISRQLGDLLDVHLENMPSYRLEVSSPGPRRPLNKKQDFHRFTGKRVKIQFQDPLGRGKKITGTLKKVNETSFIVSSDGTDVEIADQQVEKAMLAEG